METNVKYASPLLCLHRVHYHLHSSIDTTLSIFIMHLYLLALIITFMLAPVLANIAAIPWYDLVCAGDFEYDFGADNVILEACCSLCQCCGFGLNRNGLSSSFSGQAVEYFLCHAREGCECVLP